MHLELFENHTLQGNRPDLELTVSSVDDLPYHWHQDLEMIMVLKGSILFYASTLKKRLSAGDVELISVDEIHRMKGEEDNVVLSLKLRTPLAERYIPQVRDVVFDCNLHPGREAAKTIQHRFCSLLSSFFLHVYDKDDRILDDDTLEKLTEILHFIMDQFDIVSKVLNGKDLAPAEREIQQNRYRRVADFIFKNSSRRIGLRDIAERENLSLSFLSHAIKDLFGNGFQELINYQRVCTAMKLLLSTDFNITDIAFECGFSAPRYLMNRFEEFLEMKPVEFRKTYLGDGKIPEALIHDVDSLSALELLASYAAEHGAEGGGEITVPLEQKAGALRQVEWTLMTPVPGSEGSERKGTGIPLPSLSDDSWSDALDFLKRTMAQGAPPEKISGTAPDGAYTAEGCRSSLYFVLSSLAGLGEELLFSTPEALVCRGGGDSLHVLLLNDSGLENHRTELAQSFVLDFRGFLNSCRIVRKRFTEEELSPGNLWHSLGSPQSPNDDILTLMDGILCPEISHSLISRPEELKIILPPRSFELIKILPVV